MKLNVRQHPETETKTLEGAEARAILKQALKEIGDAILIAEPPFTGIMRRRCLDTLRSGHPIWTERDHNGQPYRGITITMPAKIIGIIDKDGTYHEAGDDGQAAST